MSIASVTGRIQRTKNQAVLEIWHGKEARKITMYVRFITTDAGTRRDVDTYMVEGEGEDARVVIDGTPNILDALLWLVGDYTDPPLPTEEASQI